MNKLYVISVFFILIYCLSAVCAMDVNETCDSIPADIDNDLKLSSLELNDVDDGSTDLSADDMVDNLTVSDNEKVKLFAAEENSVSDNTKNKTQVELLQITSLIILRNGEF